MSELSVFRKPGETRVVEWKSTNEVEFNNLGYTTSVLGGGELKITVSSGFQVVPVGSFFVTHDDFGVLNEMVFDDASLIATFWTSQPNV